jgi:hypothetical protein
MPTTTLPGGYLLVDRGTVIDLRGASPDSSAPFGGSLLAYARDEEFAGWVVRTRTSGLADEASDRVEATAKLVDYAAQRVEASQGPGVD